MRNAGAVYKWCVKPKLVRLFIRGNCKTSFGSRVERVERVDFDLGMSQMVRSAA